MNATEKLVDDILNDRVEINQLDLLQMEAVIDFMRENVDNMLAEVDDDEAEVYAEGLQTLIDLIEDATERRFEEENGGDWDQMRAIIASQQKDLNTVFTRHEELFHAFVVLIDADVPDKSDHAKWKAYHEMRWAARLKMVEAGFCVRCYNFVCECEVNDD